MDINKIKKCLVKILICVPIFSLSYITGKKYTQLYYYLVMFLCPISVMYAVLQLLKILYELDIVRKVLTKFAPHLVNGLKLLKKSWFEFTNSVLKGAKSTKIYKTFQYLHLKKTDRITSYTDEKIYFEASGRRSRYALIIKRWKKCTDNCDRVRFLYGKYIERQRREGKKFLLSDTPNEVVRRWGEDSYNILLKEYYYRARYNTEEKIEDCVIDELMSKQ